MWPAALKILKDNWKTLLVIAVLLGGGVWVGMFLSEKALTEQALTFSQEKQKLTDDFSAQKSAWDKERLAAASQYAVDLRAALDRQKAWQDKADALSRQMAEKERQHTRTVNDLQRRLNDALESDGGTYTGIGPASLQLWRESLGYPGAESITAGHGLSEAASSATGNTGNATGTEGGLSPSGIISHSGEYGKWCLLMRDRLQALNDFYNKE
ncbi:hypothetical protein [Trabulsiella odontotermitis]|uniref:hypothetical protein n=1 Tax=Trabulsiella odontotermitis TaxID=379893 RepID=UPI000675BF50|nr:hypothetical protein [Trabulsiella odontotermitis]KNC89914.1 hypothetical protein GM30_06100 [Trabulsiella odontotermitis]